MNMANKIYSKVKKNSKWVVIVFFILFFVYGCFTFKDYGISGDEGLQRNHSLVMYKYLVPSVSEIVTDTVNFPVLPDPKTYGVYYGVAIQLPTVAIEHLFHFELELQTVYLIRHFYNFLWFFAALIFFYKICRMFINDRIWALLGPLMLVLSPRILGDAFYNVKDLMALSTFVINTYFAILFINKISIRSFAGMILSSALCINVRIVGGVVIASCLFITFLKSISEGYVKKFLVAFFGAGIGCFLMYIMITPVSWGDILGIIEKTIKMFSNYTYWVNTNFYFGENINATQLPWHYLPVWIWISTPLVYTMFFVSGFCGSIARITKRLAARKKFVSQDWNTAFTLLIITVPILYVWITRPVLYTGWRHFYFIYPSIILIAVIGIRNLVIRYKNLVWTKFVIWGSLGISIILTVIWIAVNHPYEYVYFNPAVRWCVDENFEKDYWGTSGYDAFLYLLDYEKEDPVKVRAVNTSGYDFLKKDQRERLLLVGDVNETDYIIETYSAVSQSKKYNEFQEFDAIHSLIIDGFYVNTIFKRAYNLYSTSIVTKENGLWNFTVNDINWFCDDEELIGLLDDPVSASKFTVEFESNDLASRSSIYVSEDGSNWVCLSDQNDYTVSGNQIWGHFNTDNLAGVKIVGPGERAVLRIYQNRVSDNDIVEHPQHIVKVLGHEGSPESANAIDGDMRTDWHSGIQRPDIVFDIELDNTYMVSGLRLDPGEKTQDYPRALRMFISLDGQNYTEMKPETDDNLEFFIEPAACRYIRLITGETQESLENDWTICEVSVYTVQ